MANHEPSLLKEASPRKRKQKVVCYNKECPRSYWPNPYYHVKASPHCSSSSVTVDESGRCLTFIKAISEKKEEKSLTFT